MTTAQLLRRIVGAAFAVCALIVVNGLLHYREYLATQALISAATDGSAWRIRLAVLLGGRMDWFQSPVLAAAQNGHASSVKLLLELERNPGLHAPNDDLFMPGLDAPEGLPICLSGRAVQSPFAAAIEKRHLGVLNVLIEGDAVVPGEVLASYRDAVHVCDVELADVLASGIEEGQRREIGLAAQGPCPRISATPSQRE